MKANIKPFKTINECAAESGISRYWWRQAAQSKIVPCFRSGKKYYIDYEAALDKIRGDAADDEKCS